MTGMSIMTGMEIGMGQICTSHTHSHIQLKSSRIFYIHTQFPVKK